MDLGIHKMHIAVRAIATAELLQINQLATSALDFSRKFNSQILANRSGDDFNPFFALTKHHLEELHSRQLFYLLNPKSNHGCGGLFLEAFISLLADEKAGKWLASKPSLKDLEAASVSREHHIGWSHETIDYGRIDLLIETREHFLAIENKIGAREQKHQLQRYYNYCKGKVESCKKYIVVLYLTVEGENSKEEFEEYTSISYRHHITQWLTNLITTVGEHTKIGAGLHFYRDLLYTHVLKTKSFAMIHKMKDFLLASENRNLLRDLSAEDLHSLANAVIETRNSLRTLFFKKVFSSLKEKDIFLTPVQGLQEPIALEEVWNTKFRGFRLEDEKWSVEMQNGRKAIFCIEHNWDDLWLGLYSFQVGNSFQHIPLLKEDYKIAHDIMANIHQKTGLALHPVGEDEWITFKYATVGDCGFADDRLNYELATNMDDLVTKFVEEVVVFLDALKIVAAESKSSPL